MGLRQFSTNCQSIDAECRSYVCLKKNPRCAHDIAARDARIKPINIFHFTPFWRVDVSYAEIGDGNVGDDRFETPDISRPYRVGLTPMWQGYEDHMDEAAWNPSVPTPGETEEDFGWRVQEHFCKYQSYNFTGVY